jgi:hypothetical protein
MDEPVLPVIGEQIMHLECGLNGLAFIGNHQDQLRAKIGAKDPRQIRYVPAGYVKMKFVAAPDLEVPYPNLEFFLQLGPESRQIGHFATTFTT